MEMHLCSQLACREAARCFGDPRAQGGLGAAFLSGIAEFERDLISGRVKSGLAAAKARGKKLGRQAG